MGTTLDALKLGNCRYNYVVAIEGLSYLLTDGDPTLAVTAHAATSGGDYTTALAGLFVELDGAQAINPWEPFQGGGTCTLKVHPDPLDRLGIETHRSQAGAETALRSTVTNRSTTTIDVKRSDDLSAATAECFIGTECIEYNAKPDTHTLTASKRGKYSPFAAGGTGSPRFAEQHRVVSNNFGPQLDPVVSQLPRNWIGRWAAVWMHRVTNVAGVDVMDTKAQAHLVFAGTVAETRDDAPTGYTCVALKSVLDTIKDASLGRDFFSGTATDGIWISPTQQFGFRDVTGTSALKVANPLICVASGASTTNQINAGRYTLEDLASAINAWLGAETIAGRIYGSYNFRCPEANGNGDLRTIMHYNVPNTGGTSGAWQLDFPDSSWGTVFGVGNSYWLTYVPTGASHFEPSPNAPQKTKIFSPNGFSFTLTLATQTGTFADQYASLPSGAKNILASGNLGLPWGLFLFNESMLLLGSVSGNTITNIYAVASPLTFQFPDPQALVDFVVPLGQELPKIRQIFMFTATWANLLKQIFYSTGTNGYNHATYDVLPYGFGLGIPADLLTTFANSVDLAQGGSSQALVTIEKTKKMTDLLTADLVLRRQHLIWSNPNASLQLTSWSTPVVSGGTTLLNETNKAEPSGSGSGQQTATVLDSSWLRNVVKINYNRDVTTLVSNNSDVYSSSIQLEDGTSVDDQGGQTASVTLSAANSYGQYEGNGQGIEALLPDFLAWMPYFSRPLRKITRSIDMRFYWALSPGDIAAVTDASARDPLTGKRGVVARPGLVVKHRYNPGGPVAGNPKQVTPPAGEVEIVFLEINRVAVYVPAADVDDTASAGGFTNGYNGATSTLRTKSHVYSETSEGLDASNLFAGDKIEIVEIDPAVSASPTSWARTVSSVSTTDITLTAALATPAFDTTKKYRITSDAFNVATTTQQAKTYQAGTDATIVQLAPPFQYGAATGSTGTSLDHTTIPELHADISYGPNLGKARDVGYERAATLLLENLMDHKTAHQAPGLTTAVAAVTSGAGWTLIYMAPIFVGSLGVNGGSILRSLAIAPWFRSSDGSSTSVRVSLSGYMPNDSTFSDIIVKAPAVSNVWSTSSTTWGQGAELLFPLNVLNGFDVGWLLIEAKTKCECRGLAKCIERERVAL